MPKMNLQEHLSSAFGRPNCREWGLLYSLPSQNVQAGERGASGYVLTHMAIEATTIDTC